MTEQRFGRLFGLCNKTILYKTVVQLPNSSRDAISAIGLAPACFQSAQSDKYSFFHPGPYSSFHYSRTEYRVDKPVEDIMQPE